jgi:hypothetical protein
VVAGVTGAGADGDVATDSGDVALGALGADTVRVIADTASRQAASRQLGKATVEEMLKKFRTSPSSSPRGQPLLVPSLDKTKLTEDSSGFVTYK